MGKGCKGGKKSENGRRGWNKGHKKYACVDGVDVKVKNKAFRQDDQEDESEFSCLGEEETEAESVMIFTHPNNVI